jgi:hypothetical protein
MKQRGTLCIVKIRFSGEVTKPHWNPVLRIFKNYEWTGPRPTPG